MSDIPWNCVNCESELTFTVNPSTNPVCLSSPLPTDSTKLAKATYAGAITSIFTLSPVPRYFDDDNFWYACSLCTRKLEALIRAYEKLASLCQNPQNISQKPCPRDWFRNLKERAKHALGVVAGNHGNRNTGHNLHAQQSDDLWNCVNCESELTFTFTPSTNPVCLDSPLPTGATGTTYAGALTSIFTLPPVPRFFDDDNYWYVCSVCARQLEKLIDSYEKLTTVCPRPKSKSQTTQRPRDWFISLKERADEALGAGAGAVRHDAERKPGETDSSAAAGPGPSGAILDPNSRLKSEALKRPCFVFVERCDSDRSGITSRTPRLRRCREKLQRLSEVENEIQDQDPETDPPVPDGDDDEFDPDPGQMSMSDLDDSHSDSDGEEFKPSTSKTVARNPRRQKLKEPRSKSTGFTCIWCPDPAPVFSTAPEHINHLQTHANQPGVPTCTLPRKNESGTCGRVYQPGRRYEREHLENSHSDPCPCPVCKIILGNKRTFIHHMRNKHPELVGLKPLEKSLVCERCGKSFERQCKLNAHSRRDHADKIYTCSQPNCKYISEIFDNFKRHSKIHTTTRPTYQCHLCPKVFKTPTSLEEHTVSTHENKKRWICSSFQHSGGPGPGPRFNLKWTLIQHIVQVHGPMDKKVALEIANRPESQTDEPWVEDGNSLRVKTRKPREKGKGMQMERRNNFDDSNESSSQYFE